jgi:ribose transport system permease protein
LADDGTEQRVRNTGVARVSRLVSKVLSNYATLFLLIVLFVIFTFVSPEFLAPRNLANLLIVQSVVACMTLAALMPLICGEFDLSLGYALGMLSMFGAWLSGLGQPALVVIPAMVIAGLFIGLLNGFLTVRFHISSFISTLGVGICLSGLTLAMSGGEVLFKGIPDLVTETGQGHFLGLGISVWLTAGLAVLVMYVLEHTPLGRQWYAVGGSERVAFLSGLRTGRLRVIAFAGAGFVVGIGAVFQLGQAGAAVPGFGPDLLLPAYAASFLGLTAYRPGYYNVPGSIIAIVLLAVGFDGLSLLGAPFWAQPLFNGVALLVAVLTARAESRHIRVG